VPVTVLLWLWDADWLIEAVWLGEPVELRVKDGLIVNDALCDGDELSEAVMVELWEGDGDCEGELDCDGVNVWEALWEDVGSCVLLGVTNWLGELDADRLRVSSWLGLPDWLAVYEWLGVIDWEAVTERLGVRVCVGDCVDDGLDVSDGDWLPVSDGDTVWDFDCDEVTDMLGVSDRVWDWLRDCDCEGETVWLLLSVWLILCVRDDVPDCDGVLVLDGEQASFLASSRMPPYVSSS
jgi:hypothetical protein